MLNPSWFVGDLLQVISAEDKSIQRGLYRFKNKFDGSIPLILYRPDLDVSGRTNTLFVPFRPTLIGRGRERKGYILFLRRVWRTSEP
jgi:hypothetical protein